MPNPKVGKNVTGGDKSAVLGAKSSGKKGLVMSGVGKAKEIRQLHQEGASRKQLAKKFGIHTNTIANILYYRSWKPSINQSIST